MNSGRGGKINVQKTKVYLTAATLLVGLILAGAVSLTTTEATISHADGILIDFEKYEVTWFEYDLNSDSSPLSLLEKACTENEYTYTTDGGKVTEINGVSDSEKNSWNLWYIEKGTTQWVKSETYDINAKDYTVTAWAYRGNDDIPTVAVDATGICVYGYSQAERIVTLSPVATETIGSLNAVSCIVGTDYYSNYPNSIAELKSIGRIAEVGTYTDPSFESIMKQNPDIVIADGSQYNQRQVADSVRNANVNAVTIYDGSDIETIYNNTYLVGVAIGYELTAKSVITHNTIGMDNILSKIDIREKKSVMVALSPDAAPYVAGKYTFIDDIITSISADNAFSSMSGWTHANTELIAEKNPDIIIIVTESYDATQEEWDTMYNNLPDTWKLTKAYANKEIYLISGKAADLASRSAPRFTQLCEILGEIIYPDCFETEVPKFIGDGYSQYTVITKDLGYDN